MNRRVCSAALVALLGGAAVGALAYLAVIVAGRKAWQ